MRGRAGRALAVAVVAALAAGCVGLDATASDDARLQVVASNSIIADFASEAGGSDVEVTGLVPVGGDPHAYQPTPQDAAAIAQADVVLRHGLGLEPGLDALFEAADREVVRVTEGLDDSVERDENGEIDPHLWLVPPLAAAYVDVIADAFADADPARADAYQARAQAYGADLAELDTEIAERLAEIPRDQRVLITTHEDWHYFGEHYDVDVETLVGITTEEEPSARRVRELVDLVRDRGIPAVFVGATTNDAVIARVARDTGAAIGDELHGDSLGEPGSAADSYVGMMRHNLQALVAGLGEVDS